MGVKSFADSLIKQRKTRKQHSLKQIDAAIDWQPLADIYQVTHKAGVGCKGYPSLLMFKAVLLARIGTVERQPLSLMNSMSCCS